MGWALLRGVVLDFRTRLHCDSVLPCEVYVPPNGAPCDLFERLCGR